MNIAAIYVDYASAFEETYEDNNWARLEKYFDVDAVYAPGDGTEIKGRENILQHLRTSLDGMDRRFDSRKLEMPSDPEVTGDQTSVQWKISYQKSGIPDLSFGGLEIATFKGDLISKLEDRLDDGVPAALQGWMEKHGASLA